MKAVNFDEHIETNLMFMALFYLLPSKPPRTQQETDPGGKIFSLQLLTKWERLKLSRCD